MCPTSSKSSSPTHPPRCPVQLIQNSTKKKVYNTQGISTAFNQYYSHLYNLPTLHGLGSATSQSSDMLSFITETALPTIDPEEALDMDRSLLDTEFLGAIKGLKAGQCPGPDGFSPRFYKLFAPLLTPLLAKAFNSIDNSHPPFRRSFLC